MARIPYVREPSVGPEGQRIGPPEVVAVIVTRHRVETLRRSLDALVGQSRPPDHLIVVDNGPDDATRDAVAAAMSGSSTQATYLPSLTNLGGAGGFALGMLHALALGAAWLWLADDDGHPIGADALAHLRATADRHRLGLVSPVVVDADDPERLAFPLRRGASWARTRGDVGRGFLPGIAALFNGALVSAEAVERVGVPDLRLFVRGDEVELHRRLLRSGIAFGTDLDVAYAHPAGADEWRPILGGRTQVLVPDDDVKRHYTFRNRGYLTAQPGMRRYAAFDALRYTWYFLAVRRDVGGFLSWRRLARQGRAERFDRP